MRAVKCTPIAFLITITELYTLEWMTDIKRRGLELQRHPRK